MFSWCPGYNPGRVWLRSPHTGAWRGDSSSPRDAGRVVATKARRLPAFVIRSRSWASSTTQPQFLHLRKVIHRRVPQMGGASGFAGTQVLVLLFCKPRPQPSGKAHPSPGPLGLWSQVSAPWTDCCCGCCGCSSCS